MNILFTCAGRRVALLNAFRTALDALDVEGRLIAADVSPASAAYHTADVHELVPPVGRVEYLPALLEMVRKHRVGLIVPLTDLDLRCLARQAPRFAEQGCTVMIGTEADVKMCRDKARTNDLFAENGLGSIRTCPLQEFAEDPFYPCFVKPIRGSASVGTGLIRNEREMRAHVATYGELLLVQEYVPGQEYTIDIYRDRQGTVHCVVPRQRLAVRSGEVVKGVTVKDPDLIDAAEKLAGLLGSVWGVFCCQCRRQADGQPRFFEINPRFGGGAPLSIAAGADLPRYLLEEVLGMDISAEKDAFTDNLLMLRYDEAVFVPLGDQDREDLPGFDTPSFR